MKLGTIDAKYADDIARSPAIFIAGSVEADSLMRRALTRLASPAIFIAGSVEANAVGTLAATGASYLSGDLHRRLR